MDPTDQPETVPQPQAWLSRAQVHTVIKRLTESKPVRRTLPGNGRLHIDRQLPFLCVYRRPSDRDDPGTQRLVTGEAAHLIAPAGLQYRSGVADLVKEVVTAQAAEFGAFLLVEIWSDPLAHEEVGSQARPALTVHASRDAALDRPLDALTKRLRRIKVQKCGVRVTIVRDGKGCPANMRPLLAPAIAKKLGCFVIGLAVPPVYRTLDSSVQFPMILRSLRQNVGLALRVGFFEFTRANTTHHPPHYHALGRLTTVKAVWEADRQLARVSDAFDYLLLVTPVNAGAAFRQFQSQRHERVPGFHYRPLPVDPSLLKRQLYNTPIERIEDPALQRLLLEKQEELDLKITMLRDRDTPRFVHGSLQLFGSPDDSLLATANTVLERVVPSRDSGRKIDARAFAVSARAEIAKYRRVFPEFTASVHITDEVSGLIVSRGELLIDADLSLRVSRVNALLAHEVGTHLVTYYNGRAQPFQQLCSGLAGYEELQEGLAVLAEYLMGGLSHSRLRQLAARVVAVRHLVDGASFVDTFRVLTRDHGFSRRAAYVITMRVYRGGGLTKDAVYLRGLHGIVHYVGSGEDLAPLFVGKIAVEHAPIIRELQYRGVLADAPVLPQYMHDPVATDRLRRLCDWDGDIVALTHSP